MKIETTDPVAHSELIYYRRCPVDLINGEQKSEDVPCQNIKYVLGGFERSLAVRDIKTPTIKELDR